MKPRIPLDQVPLEALITVCAIIGVVVVLIFRWCVGFVA